jgi:hypothetical protein
MASLRSSSCFSFDLFEQLVRADDGTRGFGGRLVGSDAGVKEAILAAV